MSALLELLSTFVALLIAAAMAHFGAMSGEDSPEPADTTPPSASSPATAPDDRRSEDSTSMTHLAVPCPKSVEILPNNV